MVALANAAVATTGKAQVFEFDPFVISSFTYDDNYLRTASRSETVEVSGDDDPSELIFRNGGGGTASANVSRQEFNLSFEVADNRFVNNEQLDHLDYRVSPAWNWRVGGFCNGRLSYNNSQRLQSFNDSDEQERVRNLQRRTAYTLDGGCNVDPRFRLVSRLERNELRNSEEDRESGDRIVQLVEGGIEYETRRENAIGTRVRVADRRFPNRQKNEASASDNRFTEYDAFAYGRWRPTAKIRLNGSAGVSVRQAEDFSERNFTEPFGRLEMAYAATSKLSFTLTYLRDVFPSDDLVATFRLRDEVSARAIWQIRPKLTVTGALSNRWDEFLGDAVGAGDEDLEDRSDRTFDGDLSVNYQPIDNISISVGSRLSIRKSNQPDREYNSTLVFTSVRLSM